MNWEKVKLSFVINKLESGSRPKGGVSIDGDVPSLGAEHLRSDGGYNFDKLKKVSYEYYNSIKNGKIEKEDILIVKDGATTGKVSYVNSNFPFKSASINEHLFRLKINTNIAEPRFVFYYLFSDFGKREILLDFRGATMGGISRGFIERVQFVLPPLETQKKIAAILDKADELRRNDQEILEKYDQLARSVFLEMFGDPVTNPKQEKIVKLSDISTKITDGVHATQLDSGLAAFS
ncbi:MAG: hypothetical protein GH151_00230 [Bacteroidetes bacterium]|nr:hypothetical protein [Bacteroidota bacterium]